MIDSVFEKGNYNRWEKFINETLPLKNKIFRDKLIPCVDQILLSMLGVYSEIHKVSLDATPTFNKGLSIGVSLEYQVEDFRAPDVPVDSVNQDIEAISKSLGENLEGDGIVIDKVSIDTTTGVLSIKSSIFVDF